METTPAVTRPRAWSGSGPKLCSSFDILLPFFPTAARPCWWGGAAEVGLTSSSADGERAAAPSCGGPGLGGWTGDSTARGGCCTRVHGREKDAVACRAAACGLSLICIDLEETVDEHRLKEKELKLRLLNWNSTIDLPRQPFEASPGCVVISNSGYEIFAFSYEMEMVEADLGLIQHDAQNLDCFNWNQQRCVNLWCQGNIQLIHIYGSLVKGRTRDSIVTNNGEVLIAESKSYVFNLYMTLRQIVGSAIYTIEQDLTSKFSCTRLCWYDDMHGLNTVPVVRVDPR